MDALIRLREVQRSGGVAQAAQAGDLIRRIMATPEDPAIKEEVEVLYEAYLNDPYLTKNPKP